MKERLALVGCPQIETWEEMKLMLMEHFLLADYEHSLHKDDALKQNYKIVEEYTKEFMKVAIRNKVIEKKSHKIARYHKRLQWEIQSEVIAVFTLTLDGPTS